MSLLYDTYGSCTVCNADCDVRYLPILAHNNCNPKIVVGGYVKLLIANVGNPFTTDFSTAFTDPAAFATALTSELTTRIDNADIADDAKIRELKIVNGIKPDPTDTENDFGGCYGNLLLARDHSITFDVLEITDENYAAMQAFQCAGGFNYLFWLIDKAGYIYGGQSGILANIKMFHSVIGDKDAQLLKATLTWNKVCDPPRHLYPVDVCTMIAEAA